MGHPQRWLASAKESQIPVDKLLPVKDCVNGGSAEERSEGQRGGCVHLAPGRAQGNSINRRSNDSQKQDQYALRRTKPGGDQGQKFRVSNTHAGPAAQQPIESGDGQQKSGEGGGPCGGENRAARPLTTNGSRINDAENNSRPGE